MKLGRVFVGAIVGLVGCLTLVEAACSEFGDGPVPDTTDGAVDSSSLNDSTTTTESSVPNDGSTDAATSTHFCLDRVNDASPAHFCDDFDTDVTNQRIDYNWFDKQELAGGSINEIVDASALSPPRAVRFDTPKGTSSSGANLIKNLAANANAAAKSTITIDFALRFDDTPFPEANGGGFMIATTLQFDPGMCAAPSERSIQLVFSSNSKLAIAAKRFKFECPDGGGDPPDYGSKESSKVLNDFTKTWRGVHLVIAKQSCVGAEATIASARVVVDGEETCIGLNIDPFTKTANMKWLLGSNVGGGAHGAVSMRVDNVVWDLD